jgi:hypothetical protein
MLCRVHAPSSPTPDLVAAKTLALPQVEMARDGILHKEFTTAYDWEHIGEGRRWRFRGRGRRGGETRPSSIDASKPSTIQKDDLTWRFGYEHNTQSESPQVDGRLGVGRLVICRIRG